MRTLYRASLVFLLSDIYGKFPITNAAILCNGKQNPYTRKSDGYYVFSNLYPGTYRVDIFCKGYIDTVMNLKVRENETKIVMTDIPYAMDNTSIRNITRFQIQINDSGKPLKDTEFTLEMKENLSSVKMIKPIKPGTQEVFLNIDMKTGFLMQRYKYTLKGKSDIILLSGYDKEMKCYLLKEPAEKKIAEGGEFRPVWNLKTDSKGRGMMPLMKQFMKGKELAFTVKANGKKADIKVDIEGKEESGEVIYLDADLK